MIQNKNIAILLFGLYYSLNYKSANTVNNIDVIESNNIREFLDIIISNNNVDYFIHTSSSIYDDLLKSFFNTDDIIFDKDSHERPGELIYAKRNSRIVDLLTTFPIFKYDYFIISRIDCIFIMKLTSLDINWDKVNISVKCENDNLYDDNFYIIPFKFINKFKTILEICIQNKYRTHCIKDLFDIHIGKENINFMLDGNYTIQKFCPLYIFPRHNTRSQEGFILNRLILKPHNEYISNSSELYILNQNEYIFTSNKQGCFHWLGYYLYKPNSIITISFNILLIEPIKYTNDNQIGIKSHNPVKIYNNWLNQLKVNEVVSVSFNIEINPTNQLVILIWDSCNYIKCEISNFIIV